MPDEIERGKVRNVALATQYRDYSGLRFERNITPTDIDGSLDFGGKLFVLLEYKAKGAPMSEGQRMHLESHAKAINEGSKKAAVLVCEHETKPGEPIDGAAARVVEYIWWGNQSWLQPRLSIDTYSAILKLKKIHAQGLDAIP